MILHADLDAFYASVEQRDDPRLRGRPVVVGGGVVLAASYEAKAFGVRTAMGAGQVRRLCPRAVVVPPRFSAYVEASRAVFAIFEDTTPLVEGLSIDEAFLDVGGLRRIAGPPEGIAARLRARVREQVGLAITVGVARTKFLAKVASGVAKPDGLLVVPPDRELEFLHPLPVEALWGVGPVTASKLRGHAITTVGEVARAGERLLVRVLGRAVGRHIHALAHNRDPRPVLVGRRRHTMGTQRALGRRPRSPEQLDADLVALVDSDCAPEPGWLETRSLTTADSAAGAFILLAPEKRLRIVLVNDTMMEHPLHLHGMWMHLENGTGEYLPRKHTVIVKPAERLSVAISADAPGRWAFHCHLLLHMEAGMFRIVEVSEP